MSDGVLIALIAGIASIIAPLSAAVTTHWLGKQDRLLASEAIKTKNEQIAELEATVVDLTRRLNDALSSRDAT